MENIGKSAFKSLLIALLFVFSSQSFGQTMQEAQQAFNAGVQKIDDQPKEALAHFNEAIEISEQLGPDAEQIIIKSENQLPICHYNIARQEYRNKNMSAAIEAFKKASETGEMFNDDVKSKADRVLAQYYKNNGKKAYSADNYDEALKNLEMAEKYNGDDPEFCYLEGLTYRKKENFDEMKTAFEEAIEIGKEQKEMGIARKAEQMAISTFMQNGNSAREQGNFEQAIEFYNGVKSFDPENPEVYYGMATVYNKLPDYDKAIEAANKALEYMEDDNEKKAKVYYELGVAYKKQNNKSQACEAFSNAAYGDFKANAEYEMEHVLECN